MAQRHMPLGYCMRDGKAAIEPVSADVIQTIFTDYQKGKSTYQIAKALTEQGVLNANHEPNWYHAGVGKILENRKYLGDGFYPAIIEAEQFDAVQERRDMQRRELGRLKHPNSFAEQTVFFGKIYCGVCGKLYRKYMEHCNQPGEKTRWRCKQYIQNHAVHCRNIPLLEEEIQAAFMSAVDFLVSHPDLIDKVPKEKREPAWQVLKLEREIQMCNDSEEYQAKEMIRLIYERAKAQYQSAVIHDSFYQTEKLKAALEEHGSMEEFYPDFYQKVIRKMVVQEDGILQVIFINGVSLGIRAADYQEGRKNHGKNCSCSKEKYRSHTSETGV